MRTKCFAGILITGCALLAAAEVSHASIVTYSDRATFQANATGLTTIDFEGIAPPSDFINYGQGGSLVTGGVTITANAVSDLFANDADAYLAQYGVPFNLGAGDFIQAGNGDPAGLSLTLPVGVTALGFDLSTFDAPGTSQVTITLSTGEMVVIGAPSDGVTFFGFTSTAPVSSLSVEITAGDRRDTLNLDTLQFGAAVPEPGSIALLVSGLLPLTWVALRRRSVPPPVAPSA